MPSEEGEKEDPKPEVRWNLVPPGEHVREIHELMWLVWIANLVVGWAGGPFLIKAYPADFEFGETFIPLLLLPVVKLVPMSQICYIADGKKINVILFGALLLYVISIAQFSFLSRIPSKIILLSQVKNFKNVQDTDVNFLITHYLAGYNECCFGPEDDAPALDCNSTGFQQPCYQDDELFEELKESFTQKKCHHLFRFKFRKKCERDEQRFFQTVSGKVHRLLWALLLVGLISGTYSL